MAEKQALNRAHYTHNLSYTTRERLTGAFVILAILLLFAALAFNQQTARFFARKFTLHAYLINANGVSIGTPVTASGLFVGSVSDVSITPDNRIEITMRILEKNHRLIREDSRAGLSKLSLLGNAAIEIKAGSTTQPLMPDGATILLAEPLSMDQIMAQMVPVLEDVKSALEKLDAVSNTINPKEVGSAVHNLAVVSANLNAISSQLASGQGAVGKLLYDSKTASNVTDAVQNLAGTLAETQASLKTLQPLLGNASAASADLPALIAQSRKLITQLNTTIGTVNYQLQALPDMVMRTRQILDNTDQTLQAIQNTWPISSSVPKPSSKVVTPVHPPND